MLSLSRNENKIYDLKSRKIETISIVLQTQS